ncbi:hypothetical protein A2U01_0057374, partial [Trifolium medium]|nr:hypothetical protein [Trifolium medium]
KSCTDITSMPNLNYSPESCESAVEYSDLKVLEYLDPIAASFVDEFPEKCLRRKCLKRKYVEIVYEDVFDEIEEVSKCLKSKDI